MTYGVDTYAVVPYAQTTGPTYTGTVAFSGSGTLIVSGGFVLTGTGQLTLSGTPSTTTTMSLAGSGSLALTGTPAVAVTLAFGSTGSSTTAAAPHFVDTLAVLGGSTLGLRGSQLLYGTVALLGNSTLTMAGQVVRNITIVAFSQPMSNWVMLSPNTQELSGTDPATVLTTVTPYSPLLGAQSMLGNLTSAAPDNGWSGKEPTSEWETSLPEL